MKDELIASYQHIRRQTEQLCKPLVVEDYVVQSIEDVSPPKWHLAHTSWFFETFILKKNGNYKIFHPFFEFLFNSYYQGVGEPYPRAKRGLLSRPTVKTVFAYRQYIDSQMLELICHASESQLVTFKPLIYLGLQHEQQHQELLLMDIKHNFFCDPTFPAYSEKNAFSPAAVAAGNGKSNFITLEGGTVEIGYKGNGFCFDNELPCHKKYLLPYKISTKLVSNSEYLIFIEDGGYKNPNWWLADGWDWLNKNNIHAPLYWCNRNNHWQIFTLNGLKSINMAEPVSHVSFYEADAYARWCNARLPTEEEWENFVILQKISAGEGNFLEKHLFHPQAISDSNLNKPSQFFGDLWEWTASPYSPYPGYQPLKGILGEYNGKFMINQVVLRGGSCITPQTHIRASYRNFFQAEKRWQFSGIRLAKTI